MKPRIAIVVAKDSNNVIGCSSGLPWNIPEELKHFKKITIGKPVIMGRKTFESLGKPLKDRTNIILTRSALKEDGVFVKNSLKEALELGKKIASRDGKDEVMVIGGSEIFRLALPQADKVYLTRINGTFEGNAYFNDFDEEEWSLTGEETRDLHEVTKNAVLKCEFLVFEKKKNHFCMSAFFSKFFRLSGCPLRKAHA